MKNAIYYIISITTLIVALLIRYAVGVNSPYLLLLLLPIMMSFLYTKGSNLRGKYMKAMVSMLVIFIYSGEFNTMGLLYALTGGGLAFVSIFLTEYVCRRIKEKRDTQ